LPPRGVGRHLGKLPRAGVPAKEDGVVGLLVIFLVFLAALTVVLWVGTLGLQGLLYNDPVEAIAWRGPVSAAVVVVFVALWCWFDYQTADPLQPDLPVDTLFRFQPQRTVEVDKLWSVKVPQQYLVKKEGEAPETLVEYRRHGAGDYRDKANRPWQRADPSGVVHAIFIEENSQKVRFEADMNRDGTFANTSGPFPGYHEARGRRVMEQLGKVTVFRWQFFLPNILVNALHLGVWFAVLWLLLRFQWTHALGLAAGCWLVMTLVLLPMLLDRAQELAREKAGLGSSRAAGSVAGGLALAYIAKPR